ncbi:electron transport complex subunit RsxG [Pseudomonas sp. BGr12]|uniref:electron transport complex subunit RsxG n=1 Tax=unclassified Pseudomonas TaxID=196821 RepID=UPI00177C297D|nr:MULTISPECIES: electron transport complex subunit RsxG [unclassified Pseudomonas]MBD9574224.1 electron transport complex subunit RsxG [Pseudomonas sp. PDM23]MBD9672062.1 electron transport complex subunit RsxG [Pseudomonas sp. PDM21]MDL2425683.1 electron transport complex subunit RsxG [Pseudomonas sp. BJa5]
MNRTLLKNALALGLLAVLAAGVVAIVHQLTAQRIDTAQREARGRTLLELLPRGSYDNHPLETEVSAFDPKLLGRDEPAPAYLARLQGQTTAVVLQPVAQDGYGGSIQLLVGVTSQGRLLGVRVLAHHETPGQGDRIELGKSDWLHGFDGHSLSDPAEAGWKVKKDGGQFDQFAGATVTPRAVVKATHLALQYFDAHKSELLAPATSGDKHE